MVDFKRALAESRAKRLREEYGKEVDRVLKELDEEVELFETQIEGRGMYGLTPSRVEKIAKLLKDVRRLLILVFK